MNCFKRKLESYHLDTAVDMIYFNSVILSSHLCTVRCFMIILCIYLAIMSCTFCVSVY